MMTPSSLEAEDHVELLALEPADGVGVLRHGQRLAADAEDEPSHLHQGEALDESAQPEEELASDDDGGEDDGAEADAEHAGAQFSRYFSMSYGVKDHLSHDLKYPN